MPIFATKRVAASSDKMQTPLSMMTFASHRTRQAIALLRRSPQPNPDQCNLLVSSRQWNR